MDVHPTKNGIFIGIDPSPYTKPMPVLQRPQCQVQCGEASVEEDRRRILHAICGSDGAGGLPGAASQWIPNHAGNPTSYEDGVIYLYTYLICIMWLINSYKNPRNHLPTDRHPGGLKPGTASSIASCALHCDQRPFVGSQKAQTQQPTTQACRMTRNAVF